MVDASSAGSEEGRKTTRKFAWPAHLVAAGVATVVFAALVNLVAGSACLPELDPLKVVDDAGNASDTPAIGPAPNAATCGDGIIDTLDDGGATNETCDPGDAGNAIIPGCETNCRFTCAGGAIDPKTNHCYFAVDAQPSYGEATQACALAGGHLLTLASTREAAFAFGDASTSDAAPSTTWIGLLSTDELVDKPYKSAAAGEPGYPNGTSCPGCFGIGVTDAGLFPDAGEANRCLASPADGGAWFAVPCSATVRTTICEREPIGQRAQFCGGPFCTTIPITAGAKRYVLVLSEATATQANDFCTSNYGANGGRLVVLGTREEREQLVNEIRVLFPPTATSKGSLKFWIGLSRPNDGGVWRWDDNVDGTIEEDDGGHALEWGNKQPSAGGASRAFLRVENSVIGAKFDTQLAFNEDEATHNDEANLFFICERK